MGPPDVPVHPRTAALAFQPDACLPPRGQLDLPPAPARPVPSAGSAATAVSMGHWRSAPLPHPARPPPMFPTRVPASSPLQHQAPVASGLSELAVLLSTITTVRHDLPELSTQLCVMGSEVAHLLGDPVLRQLLCAPAHGARPGADATPRPSSTPSSTAPASGALATASPATASAGAAPVVAPSAAARELPEQAPAADASNGGASQSTKRSRNDTSGGACAVATAALSPAHPDLAGGSNGAPPEPPAVAPASPTAPALPTPSAAKLASASPATAAVRAVEAATPVGDSAAGSSPAAPTPMAFHTATSWAVRTTKALQCLHTLALRQQELLLQLWCVCVVNVGVRERVLTLLCCSSRNDSGRLQVRCQ